MNEMFSQGGKGSTGILTNKQAIARKFGVKQNEVVYFSVGVDLGGYKVIYDKSTQRAYSLPVLPVGTTAVSLNEHAVLVHSAGTVDLGELAVEREEFVTVTGSFIAGATINTKNELLTHTDGKYRWAGSLPKTVPENSSPENSGGLSDSAWVSVSLSNFEDKIKSPTGSYTVGHDDTTVGDKLDSLSHTAVTPKIYKDIFFDRSLNFSGYATALSTIGGTYLIPQGFDISEDDLVFINMVSSEVNPTLRAIVVYDLQGMELTWFYIEDSGLQSLSVTGALPNIKLYDGGRSVGGYLQEYTLSSLPIAGTTITARTPTGVTGLTTLFHVRNGFVACFSSAARIGLYTNDDSVITIRNLSTGEVHSTIQVSRMLVGFTIGTMYGISLGPDYQTMCWKLQGIALHNNGNVLLTVGGYWETGNSETKPISDLGVIEINAQGEIVRHSVVRNGGFRNWLTSKGYDATRTECEGVTVDSEGNIISLLIGQFLPSNTGHNLFLCREFASSGIDMSAWFSVYKPLAQRDLENPIRASNGRYENPLTHAAFTNVEDLLKFMVLMNIRKFSWFSQIEPQLVFTGITWNGIQKYEVFNLNNTNMIVTVHSTAEGYSNYRVDYSLTTGTYTVTKIRIKTNALHTDTIVTDGNVVMTLDRGYWYPAVASALTLGTAAKPFDNLYTQNTPIVVSDERLKNNISSVPDAVLDAWATVNYSQWKMNTAAEQKGSDSARLHIGIVAQEIRDKFLAAGLDATEYGILVYDSWEAKEEVKGIPAVYSEDGTLLIDAEPGVPGSEAGDIWMVRMDECLALEAALMRRTQKKLEERLAALEAK